jgi:hypothetical protein
MLVHQVVYDWLEAYFHLPRPIWKLYPAFEPHRLKSLLSEIMMMAEDMTSFFLLHVYNLRMYQHFINNLYYIYTVTNTNRIATYQQTTTMADSKATKNPDSLTSAQGEFSARIAPSEPLTTSGHQVGQKVSPADHAPEFSAKVLPAGTAPKDKTFTPNPENEVPGQADNADVVGKSDPLDFPGATSGDVHTGLGHPGSGQTSTELHGSGKKERSGLAGAGAQGGTGLREDGMNREFRELGRERGVDEHGPNNSRPRDGGAGREVQGAESVVPVGAGEVAAERD